MRMIETNNFTKLAKSKYPKSETEPYNPWAVCNNSTGGKKKNKKKFERCVEHLRDQNKEDNKKKKKSEDLTETKPVGWGETYNPNTEDSFVEQTKGQKLHRKGPVTVTVNKDKQWDDLLSKMRKLPRMELSPVMAESKENKKT